MRSVSDFLPDGTGSVTTEDVAALLLAEADRTASARTRIGVNGAPQV